MSHVYTHTIDDVVKGNKVHRFNGELLDEKDDYRSRQLKHILHDLQDYVPHAIVQENKMKNHINVLRSSRYNKRWQDLQEPQKINRIEKYIKENKIGLSIEDINRLKEYLIKNILLTKHIKYDRYIGVIKDITVINNINDTYILEDLTSIKKRVQKKKIVTKKR
jgi:hypothetical protein